MVIFLLKRKRKEKRKLRIIGEKNSPFRAGQNTVHPAKLMLRRSILQKDIEWHPLRTHHCSGISSCHHDHSAA